jgi:hypothetical protein
MPKHVGVKNLEFINKTFTNSLSICCFFLQMILQDARFNTTIKTTHLSYVRLNECGWYSTAVPWYKRKIKYS